ncbi:ComEC/Rec2 family competence protein [Myroides sp. DW712]|uniref:ComEC/Rec2 family competence protein n=1 Tax=Myroides sp. DW712 TaxID=3389800 RepID=UPI00397A3014
MSPLKFSFLFYATAVASGILAKDYCSLLAMEILFLLLFGVLVVFAYSKQTWLFHPIAFYGMAMLYYSLSFILGFMSAKYSDWQDTHASYTTKLVDQHPYEVNYRVIQRHKKTKVGSSYVVVVEAVDEVQTQGKALLLVTDSVREIGSRFRAIGKFRSFPTAVNPGQFDYRLFMERKHIAKQLWVQQEIEVPGTNNLYVWLMKGRATLQHQIEANTALSRSSKALLNALLLGDKSQMEEQTVATFQQLGLMHILAISGLHIGIIALAVTGLTSFLKRQYRLLVLLLFLWIFAFMAGFSPSVFRTVLMCTLLMLSQFIQRNQIIGERIGLALFLSLLFEPNWLFDVGFQLSYVAVLGLVFGMPLFRSWYTKSRVVNYGLGLLYVSFVAQLSVLPLQLYYFHSFSWSFLGSNLLIIPLITLLILSGFCLLCVGWISSVIAMGLGWLIEQMVRVAFIVLQGLEGINVSVNTAYIAKETAIILFILSWGFALFWYQPRIKQVVYLGFLVLVTQVECFHLAQQQQGREEFIIAAVQGRKPLYLQAVGRQLFVFGQEEDTKGVVETYSKHYLPKAIENKPRADWYPVDAKRKLLVLSKEYPNYPVNTKFELIYLMDNVPVNIDRLLTLHQPQQLILGYAMRKGYKNRVIQHCIKKKIPFHDMREKGYWSSQFF